MLVDVRLCWIHIYNNKLWRRSSVAFGGGSQIVLKIVNDKSSNVFQKTVMMFIIILPRRTKQISLESMRHHTGAVVDIQHTCAAHKPHSRGRSAANPLGTNTSRRRRPAGQPLALLIGVFPGVFGPKSGPHGKITYLIGHFDDVKELVQGRKWTLCHM